MTLITELSKEEEEVIQKLRNSSPFASLTVEKRDGRVARIVVEESYIIAQLLASKK